MLSLSLLATRYSQVINGELLHDEVPLCYWCNMPAGIVHPREHSVRISRVAQDHEQLASRMEVALCFPRQAIYPLVIGPRVERLLASGSGFATKIGWIAHDQIELLAGKRSEHVSLRYT